MKNEIEKLIEPFWEIVRPVHLIVENESGETTEDLGWIIGLICKKDHAIGFSTTATNPPRKTVEEAWQDAFDLTNNLSGLTLTK